MGLFELISLIVVGLIVGALGRLLVPGDNPMPLWLTTLLGVASTLVAGWLASAVLHWGRLLTFLLAVALAALVVGLTTGLSRRRRHTSG